MSRDELDENDSLKQDEAGNREAMRELSHRLERCGRTMLHESRDWLDRASHSGPLDRLAVEASLELARFHMSAREYEQALSLLHDRERPIYGLSAQDRVLIHPEALGRGSSLAAMGTRTLPTGLVCSP
jgi:hypothetical protein